MLQLQKDPYGKKPSKLCCVSPWMIQLKEHFPQNSFFVRSKEKKAFVPRDLADPKKFPLVWKDKILLNLQNFEF
mgnify:CR=1 FL=1